MTAATLRRRLRLRRGRGDAGSHARAQWRAAICIEKFHGDYATREDALEAEGSPYAVDEREGNLLLIGGVSCQWQTLIGNGSAVAGGALTYFNNANAAIAVGGGAGATTAAANTQTDLQGATKTRKGMDATYPQHTDSASSAGALTITFRATFGAADGNHAWDEWGVANSPVLATGRLLNRKVEALGTKAAGTWVFTVTVQIS